MSEAAFRSAPWTVAVGLAVVVGGAMTCRADAPGALVAHELKCEARVGPLGIDATAPRLSWVVSSDRRGARQSAYQVLVATDRGRLAEGKADLWDSGKVESDATFGVGYAGKPLASHQRVFWTVRVWDGEGKASAWSEGSTWSMGLLRPADLAAAWIGYDRPRQVEAPAASFGAAKWIWHAADEGASKPKGHRLFVAGLTLPADAKVEAATLLLSADDTSKFTVNGALVASNDGHANVVEADLATHLKPGANTLRAEVENRQPGPAGLIARLVVKLAGGRTVEVVTDGAWKSTNDPGANWHDRPLDTAGWPAAAVVGNFGDAPWGKLTHSKVQLYPTPYLRHEFILADRPVRHATLYAASLGLTDVYLNGRRVNPDYFPSGWTDYNRRVYYRAYDVTKSLKPLRNALGAVLADGWYSGYVGFGAKRDHYGKKPRLLVQLHVEYEDGTCEDVGTGPGWKAATGPTLEADFLQGEAYDAREDLGRWSEPAYDDRSWGPVDVGAELAPKLEAHPGPPVVVFSELRPKSITQPTPGAYVLDMGRNFAGVVRLKVKGTPGQSVRLRFAERLNPDGTIYTTNLRSARSIDTYVCKGEGVETWSPRFTFHGFQYVEVTGLKEAPGADTITGLAISSDTPVVGEFDCSDPMLNQLHSNVYWTQRANFIDIPTDCPQRDERLGWTGDAQAYIRTASLNTDVQAFFTKWLVDLTDGQRADGQFPMVAPVKVAGDDGGPAWADAGVICPWTVYQVYGDRQLLERQYPSMVRFIEFCQKRSQDGLLPPKQYHCFGDWLSIKADTPKDVIYTAYYAYSTRLTAKAAEVLGKADDARRFEALYQAIKQAFNKTYVRPDGRIAGDTQTCYVLALAFDLLDGERARQAAEHLVADIQSKGNHLSTGFVGTKDLMLVLSKIGRVDVAYTLLHNTTFPSWGFSIKQGATSIWERWDGWTPEHGFQDPGMNSFAHYAFGAVYQWMVENIGGIRADTPSYRTFTIAPVPDPKLTRARVSYRSVRGEIVSAWSRGPAGLAVEVTVPANTTAEVHLPAARFDDVTESGAGLDRAEGVGRLRCEGGKAVLRVGPGRYRFESRQTAVR